MGGNEATIKLETDDKGGLSKLTNTMPPQLVPVAGDSRPTRLIHPTQKGILASLHRLERYLSAPVVPILDERGNFVGARRDLPEELEEIVAELPLSPGGAIQPAARSTAPRPPRTPREFNDADLGNPWHRWKGSKNPATMGVVVSIAGGVLGTVSEVRGVVIELARQIKAAEGEIDALFAIDLDGRIATVEQQSLEATEESTRAWDLAEKFADRIASLEERTARAEQRNTSLEQRATTAEAHAAQAEESLQRVTQLLNTSIEAHRSDMARVDAFIDRMLDLEGRAIDDIDLSATDRDIRFILRAGSKEIVRTVRLDFPLNRGIYRSGQAYARGDIVTYAGSAFVAERDTTPAEKPESSSAFRLLVKRGRDGKSARPDSGGYAI